MTAQEACEWGLVDHVYHRREALEAPVPQIRDGVSFD
jgi:ATP-dependent protease ClpP protease subunit